MNEKLQEILTRDFIFTANDTLQYRSCQDPFLEILKLFCGECPTREGPEDEVGDFVEKDLRLLYDNVSQTIDVVILDDSDSEVEELQEMKHLVTDNPVFGCHSSTLLKAEDTTLQLLQFQAEQEVSDGVCDGELFTTSNKIVDFGTNGSVVFVAL